MPSTGSTNIKPSTVRWACLSCSAVNSATCPPRECPAITSESTDWGIPSTTSIARSASSAGVNDPASTGPLGRYNRGTMTCQPSFVNGLSNTRYDEGGVRKPGRKSRTFGLGEYVAGVDVMAAIVPLALVIGLSPISILPALLLAASVRPTANSAALIGGWLLTLAALLLVAMLVTDTVPHAEVDQEQGIGWVSLVTGFVFVGFGVVKWFRARGADDRRPPRWMAQLESYSPGKSARLGVILAGANPKNIALTLAGGAEIALFIQGGTGSVVAALTFLAVGSIGVLAPSVLRAGLGSRSDRVLASLRGWFERNSTTMSVVVLIGLGALLVVKALTDG